MTGSAGFHPRRHLRALPCGPGVYRFCDTRDAVLYIGRAADLRHRVASYWSDLRGRRHLEPMVAEIARIEAVTCASRHEAAWLERNLLETSLPPWNRTTGGEEVPVVIVLDGRPSACRLLVAPLASPVAGDVRLFGPYLGGLQVRRAVSGLQRIYPLAYASVGLSPAGRAMAEQRGVSPSDRRDLIQSLTSVLMAEPAAVSAARDRMEQVRDRAVAADAFELAGRISVELQGLDWVSSLERVSVLDDVDVDVAGWSDGVLVTFAVRAGRLRTWTARRCDRASAAAHLAATPSGWADFAQRNANLAADLDRRSADHRG